MILPNEPINGVKSHAVLDASPETVARLVHSYDVKLLQQFDKDVYDIRKLQSYTDDLIVAQTLYSAPFPVAWRDAILLRSVIRLPDGTIQLINTSINDSRAEELSGYVRCYVKIAGWIIKPLEDGKKSFCIRLAQIDPRGWIPPFVVNLFKRKLADGVISIDEVLRNQTKSN